MAPLSVLYNWKDELETWGHFQCVVVHGLRKEEELARINKGRVEIALTTYETLRLCLDQFNKQVPRSLSAHKRGYDSLVMKQVCEKEGFVTVSVPVPSPAA